MGGEQGPVPSSAIFPFCLSNYAAEFINFQRYRSQTKFLLSFSLSLNEKEKKERKVWKRKSVISNREKVLPQQTTSPPLSLFFPIPSSLSPSLVILLLVRVPIVYPRPPATPFRPFINRGIAHPRKYGVRKSFKLPHGRSFAFLFKPR